MNEDEVTESLASKLTGREKEVAYDFLLKPFNYSHRNIESVATQKAYGATRPDLVIYLDNGANIRIEVKINNAPLTESEKSPYTRNLFIVPADYKYRDDIPPSIPVVTWTDFFRYCNRRHCEIEIKELKELKATVLGE